MLHDRVSGSLGRRLLMTSTQEPNTMVPQSALCICSRKWKTKLIVPKYFGTKTSKFCFRIISFTSLESELGFDSEDTEINFDRARSTTVNSPLRALRAICNISSDDGEDFFANHALPQWPKNFALCHPQRNTSFLNRLATAKGGKCLY